MSDEEEKESQDFTELSTHKRQGLVGEFWDFLVFNKKWWLLPIVLVLLILGALVMLGGTAFAPFIYTLF